MIPTPAAGGLERLRAGLTGIPFRAVPVVGPDPCLEIEREHLLPLARALRDELGFETCTFVTAVDLFPAEPRYRVVHAFLSLARNERVRLHCPLRAEDAVLPSITGLWPGARSFEREAFDMFGIRFDGHPDLRRLLMPEEYEHFPLRKDFPHQGIEPDRLYRAWDAKRRRTPLEQR